MAAEAQVMNPGVLIPCLFTVAAIMPVVVPEHRLADFCDRTAAQAFAACRLDAADSFHQSQVACRNTPDRQVRRECREKSVEDRREELGACRDRLDAWRELCEEIGRAAPKKRGWKRELPPPGVRFRSTG